MLHAVAQLYHVVTNLRIVMNRTNTKEPTNPILIQLNVSNILLKFLLPEILFLHMQIEFLEGKQSCLYSNRA